MMLGRRLVIGQPKPLLELAKDAFCKAASAPVKYILDRRGTSLPPMSHVDELCNNLQSFIKENIPENIIDAVSMKLIANFVAYVHVLEENATVKDIYISFLKASLNNRVIALDCNKFHSWNLLCDIEGKQLALILKGLDPKGFCFREGCVDTILAIVIKSCPRLRKLDVTWSSGVTNLNFAGLLQLSYLWELRIMGTSVRASGHTEISPELYLGHPVKANVSYIKRRSAKHCQLTTFTGSLRLISVMHISPVSGGLAESLRSFTCSDISTSDLNALLMSCPNLTHIGLDDYHQAGKVTVPDRCKIKALSFHRCKYQDLVDILMALGQRLHCLEMRLLYSVALMDVMFLCRSLCTLKMSNLISPWFIPTETTVRMFEEVEHLNLNVEDSLEFACVAVLRSKKLKVLKLLSARNEAVDKVVGSTNLQLLQELHVCSVSLSTARSLLRRCPNLRVVAGLDISSIESTSAFIEEARVTHPYVQFSGAVPLGAQPQIDYFGL